jgi:hypothetical protein
LGLWAKTIALIMRTGPTQFGGVGEAEQENFPKVRTGQEEIATRQNSMAS